MISFFIAPGELTLVHLAIPTQPNGGNHTPEFTESSRTPEAHATSMRVAKGLALVGIRVLDDTAFFKEVCIFSLDRELLFSSVMFCFEIGH